ncbi:MAG TPA: transcription-repair coupling factor [Candidatus Dormibacteraeota bacterium]|nr:transcription-repair coupling factor [Candidatus Dormibacteraeota bacterium]
MPADPVRRPGGAGATLARPRSVLARMAQQPLGQGLRDWMGRGAPASSAGGVIHAAAPLLASVVRDLLQLPVCLVVAEPEPVWQEVKTWTGESDVLLFPAADVLPFDRIAPSGEVVRHRLATLRGLRATTPQIVVTSLPAILRPTLSPERIGSWRSGLESGARIPPSELATLLLESGYRQESIVSFPGEFARRGGIVDCFPIEGRPWRAEWEGDRVAGLWRLDPETQGSRGTLDLVALTQAREFSLDRSSLAAAAQRLGGLDLESLRDDVRERWQSDLELLREGALPDPADALGPLLADPAQTLLRHLQAGTVILTEQRERLVGLARAWLAEVESIHQAEVDRAELPRDLLGTVAPLDSIVAELEGERSLDLRREPMPESLVCPDVEIAAAPTFAGDVDQFAAQVRELRRATGTVLVLGMQEERVQELTEERSLEPVRLEDFSVATTELSDSALLLAPGDLEAGLVMSGLRLAVFSDSDIFGSRKRRASSLLRTVRRAESSAAGRLRQATGSGVDVADFRFKLEPGDVVVHRDHGVGRFLAMSRVADGGSEREYMQLEYSDGHKLYVPVEHLDRIEKYSGGGGEHPQLSRLGTGEWERTRRAVRRRVEEIAEELVELYARRLASTGHAFAADSRWQQELESSFPYQETRDQLLVLNDIKRDMESPRPMDRLLCGDVGFGKTEIALRAAFKAVEDGYQVAVLVPTTVLAQQHHLTFQERLAAFPIAVEQLSRMRSDEEAQTVLGGLAAGTVDIVIGTHRLLQRDVRFKNLGLVVLDEEQRFGVLQKERLKQLRTAVDVLSLSATPIPRTLHMALAGIRDLSVVRTPPEGRLPIRTYVTAKEAGLVQDVIRRELARQGQAYYVHNRVQTIQRELEWLRQLVPDARFAVAHGQMDERALAKVMVAFMAGEVDVLCCTTIIENGLDIPNANTLVVDDASRMGLSQLYQLRGRVGRSGQRAYAYFLYDPERSLSERADKRLDVVADLQDLGSGFALALKDLEIRGAGNVLGEAQHGDIAAVGLETYNHLLRQAVLEARGEELAESPAQVAVNLPFQALLPPEYVPDERLRLRTYQQLAGATRESELDESSRNLRQRFGPRPEALENLILALRIRLLAAEVGARSVETDGEDVVVSFEPGHGLPIGELGGPGQGRAWEAGSNRLRLRAQLVGESWPELLISVLRQLAQARAGKIAGLPRP